MIVFDLRCAGGGHVFESWFANSATFDDHRARGLLICPLCGDTAIDKALMAPNVGSKGNQARAAGPAGLAASQEVAAASPASSRAVRPVPFEPGADPQRAEMRAALAHIATLQAQALKESTWVGRSFEAKARAMHDGDAPAAPIHGQATIDQARAMIEDGIAVMPLIVPVVPPEQVN